MKVSELLSQIPQETKELVQSYCAQYSGQVREALRKEIRWPLIWHDAESSGGWLYKSEINISVDEIGRPQDIDIPDIPDEYELAAKLQYWLPKLHMLSESSQALMSMLNNPAMYEMLARLLDVSRVKNAFNESNEFSNYLIELASLDQFDLVEHILAVDKDILGCFRYSPAKDPFLLHSPTSHHGVYKTQILLYWGVIGLTSSAKNIDLKGLTVKVLAHELAHAYTYLGFDRSGARWTARGFSGSQHKLKEGLAQYYTWRVLGRLKKAIPEGLEAYSQLLPLQPEAYRSQEPWIEFSDPESVANTLSLLRSEETINYERFSTILKKVTTREITMPLITQL